MMMIDNNNNNYDDNDDSFDDNGDDDDDDQPVDEEGGEPQERTGALPRICSKVPEICAILITHRQDCHLLKEKERKGRRARFCEIMARMVVVVMLLMMIRIIIIMTR